MEIACMKQQEEPEPVKATGMKVGKPYFVSGEEELDKPLRFFVRLELVKHDDEDYMLEFNADHPLPNVMLVKDCDWWFIPAVYGMVARIELDW